MFRILTTFIIFSLPNVALSDSVIQNRQVFSCFSGTPDFLSISVSEVEGKFELDEFSLNEYRLSQPVNLQNIRRNHYHRALVDEKSFEFDHKGYSVLVSDYHSEELGEDISVLSVTIEKNGNMQYIECGEGSVSSL